MTDVAKGDAFLERIKEEKGEKHAEAIKFVVEATETLVTARRVGLPEQVRDFLAAQTGHTLAGYFKENFGELKGAAYMERATEVRTDVVAYLAALGRLPEGTRWDETRYRVIEPDGNETGLAAALAKMEPLHD